MDAGFDPWFELPVPLGAWPTLVGFVLGAARAHRREAVEAVANVRPASLVLAVFGDVETTAARGTLAGGVVDTLGASGTFAVAAQAFVDLAPVTNSFPSLVDGVAVVAEIAHAAVGLAMLLADGFGDASGWYPVAAAPAHVEVARLDLRATSVLTFARLGLSEVITSLTLLAVFGLVLMALFTEGTFALFARAKLHVAFLVFEEIIAPLPTRSADFSAVL
jgi:hypothetical protein